MSYALASMCPPAAEGEERLAVALGGRLLRWRQMAGPHQTCRVTESEMNSDPLHAEAFLPSAPEQLCRSEWRTERDFKKGFCSLIRRKDEGERPVANSIVSSLTRSCRGCEDSANLANGSYGL